MTTYIRKMPAAIAVIFFAVAGFSAIYSGSGIILAVGRGFLAGLIVWPVAALLAYVIFEEEIPEADIPEGMEKVAERIKDKNR